MSRSFRISLASLLACLALIICLNGADSAFAETIEKDFYRFDTETGIMHVFASVPDESGWYDGLEDGSVKEIIFDETENDIDVGDHGFGYDQFRNLEKITFSSSVKSIGDRAFMRGMYKFPDFEIVFAEGLETIGENAFSENERTIDTLKLPTTLKSVGEGAFISMKIKHLQLPVGIESISPWAFRSTSYYDDLIGINYSCMGGALYNKDMTALVAYPCESPTGEFIGPNGLKNILQGAFYQTKGLKAIVLPEGFERIEDSSMKMEYPNSQFTIIFPSTMKYIGMGNNFNGLYYDERYFRGTKEQAKAVEDNSGLIFDDFDSDRWFYNYDIDDITFPEEITLKVGETVLLPFTADPVTPKTDETRAAREIAVKKGDYTGTTRDIDNFDIVVINGKFQNNGVEVTGVAEGNTIVGAFVYGRYRKCMVHISGKQEKDLPKKGDIATYGGADLTILSTDAKTAALTKAPSKKSVTVPSSFKYKGVTFKVTQVNAGAFAKSKATTAVIGANVKTLKKYAFKGSKVKTVQVKTKKLTKSSVKGSLAKSKVTTVKVKVGTKKVNKTYVTKYRKIFTKKNAGRKAAVK